MSSAGVNDLVVLITGGTSGIGLACVKALLQAGAFVAFTGRRAEIGEKLVAETLAPAHGAERCVFVPGDVTVAADREHAVAQALDKFGRIDVLINNAGVVLKASVLHTSEEAWDAVFDVNLKAGWQMAKLVLPHMKARRSGNIIFNGSDWALVGARDYAAYAVSKAAVVQLVRCIALEHTRDGIRCNAVCPGDTEVERWHTEGYGTGSGGPVTAAEIAADGADLPLGRVCTAAEIAAAVVFLASREPRSMTGTTLTVDGGNTAQ